MMGDYFVGYEITHSPVRQTVYYRSLTHSGCMANTFGWFELEDRYKLVDIVFALNLAQARGAEHVRNQFLSALGLTLPIS